MKIISFEWDNAKGEEYTGRSFFVAQLLPKRINEESTHVECHGICLDIIDNSKDFRLHNYSCSTNNLSTEVCEITKDDARKQLYKKIDEALDLIFDSGEMDSVDKRFNVYPSEEQSTPEE